MPFLESLEPRLHLAADPGETPGTARNLGALTGVRTVLEQVGPNDYADYYRFTLASRSNFNAYLSPDSKSASIKLYNSRDEALRSAQASAGTTARINRALNPGTYFIRISRVGGLTDYRLKLRADLNWTTLSNNGDTTDVGLEWASGSRRPILANKPTWIIMHGWTSTPDSFSLPELAQAIDDFEEGDQVLMLDWSDAVSSLNILSATAWIPEVADWVKDSMDRWGIPASKVNLVGHSLGGWLTGVLADQFDGPVNRIYVLDPATDPSPFFLSGLNYGRDSRFAAGFIATSNSTPEAAATADITFQVDIGDDSLIAHTRLVGLVASIFDEGNSASPDPISAQLSIGKLSPGVTQPYKLNAFSGGYEALLDGTSGLDQSTPTRLEYRDRVTGQTVVLVT